MTACRLPVAALCAVLLVSLALPSFADEGPIPPEKAQGMNAHSKLKGFRICGKYLLEKDGERVKDAKVYYSRLRRTWLVLDSGLELDGKKQAIAVARSGNQISTLPITQVARRVDGLIFAIEDAEVCSQSRYDNRGDKMAFRVGDLRLALVQNPPLLDWHDRKDLLSHTPEYRVDAETYEPDAAALEVIAKREGKLRVKVYFGSWCTACSRVLGRILKIEEALQAKGLDVEFKYFGLPQRDWQKHPEAKEQDIRVLPTGIVVAGETTKRVSAKDLAAPEKSLAEALGAN